jgi:SAM-dependent methyltransferase
MAQVNLLRSLPQTKRNVAKRKEGKDAKVIAVAKEFGQLYFDGPREYGYGGYKYDGRWIPVARDIVQHFGVPPGGRVLDVGCAKGFLVKDLLTAGVDAYGIDISEYALMNCPAEVVGRLHLGSADRLPFPDKSFDAVISINTLHNLDRDRCIRALQEMTRLCRNPKNCFMQVDAYRTAEEKELFESWCLTAITYLTPDEWGKVFKEASYTGDFDWTILEPAAQDRTVP